MVPVNENAIGTIDDTVSPDAVRCVRRLLHLLDKWGGVCVVCGQPLKTLMSATVEHVAPKSLVASHDDNLAVSHRKCNEIKSNKSLLAAAKTVDKMRAKMHPRMFEQWLHAKVSNRPKILPMMLPLHEARLWLAMNEHVINRRRLLSETCRKRYVTTCKRMT